MGQQQARTTTTIEVAARCAPVVPGLLVHRLRMVAALMALGACPVCRAPAAQREHIEGDVFTHCCEVAFSCGAGARVMHDASVQVIDGCKAALAVALDRVMPDRPPDGA